MNKLLIIMSIFANMKTLYIVRHGKAENPVKDAPDFMRKLSEKAKEGINNAAEKVKKLDNPPELFISSEAKRAYSTAKRFAELLGFDKKDVKLNPTIYNSHADNLVELIRAYDDKYKTIMMFGHNPGFTLLVHFLTGENINLETAGVAVVELNIKHWEETANRCGKLKHLF